MANITITNNDLDSPILQDAVFRDDTIDFAGADTLAPGTIMARQTVDTAVADGTADGGNTGDGTVDSITVVEGDIVPLAGNYTLTCIEAVTNGGIFKLEDPNGAIVAPYLQMDAGSGNTTTFEVAGLQFDVTDGATDFAAGDFFTITVVANGKLKPFALTGAGGAQFPIAILTYEVAVTGSGDEPVRVAVAGRYRKEKLVIDADGDDSNIDDTVIDQLRDHSLVPINVNELNIADNS